MLKRGLHDFFRINGRDGSELISNLCACVGIVVALGGLFVFFHALVLTPLNPFTNTLGQWGNDWFFFFNDLPIFVPLFSSPIWFIAAEFFARFVIKLDVDPYASE